MLSAQSIPRQLWEYENLDWISTDVDAIVIKDKWYEVLSVRYVKLFYLISEQTNDGAAAETIEVRLTRNGGTPNLNSGARDSGVQYHYRFAMEGSFVIDGSEQQLLSLDGDQSVSLETESLLIEARQTSVVDAVSAQIEINGVYKVQRLI